MGRVVIALLIFAFAVSSAAGQPNDGVTDQRQDAVRQYLETTAIIGDASDALLDEALSDVSQAHGASWWQVFTNLLALEDISNSLLEQRYADAIEKLAIHVGEGAIRTNATMNRLLGGADIARLAVLPIQIPLNDLAKHMSAEGFEYQQKQYYRLRLEFDFILADVLAGKEPTDVALYDDSGFLKWLDIPEGNRLPQTVWHPGGDWTPESLYGFIDALYEAERSASRFEARKRVALADFSDQLRDHESLQQAQPVVWDASIVVPDDADVPRLPCSVVPDREGCLRDLGLSEATIDFAKALKVAYPALYSSFLPIEFVELGAFDLVQVPMSGAAGGSYSLAVNGNKRKIISILQEMNDASLEDRFMDGASTRILYRERQASGWAGFVIGHRILPDGTQRFVVATNITTSCRACPLAGIGLSYVDISGDGTVRSQLDIGIMDVSNLPNALANRPWPSDVNLLGLPARQLQYLLNLRGYDAGSMDGAIGPRTRQALADFQNELSIDTSRGNADRVTQVALADTSTFFKNGFEGLYTSLSQAEVGTAPLPGCAEPGETLSSAEVIEAFSGATAIDDMGIPERYGAITAENEAAERTVGTGAPETTVRERIRVTDGKLCHSNKYGEFCEAVRSCNSDDARFILTDYGGNARYMVALKPSTEDGRAVSRSGVPGGLCREVGQQLNGAEMHALLRGSVMRGVNARGETWEERLGNAGETLFVNASGARFPGRYRIDENQICFSYGDRTTWSCKTVSPCLSGEGSHSIAELDGTQTSVLTSIVAEAVTRDDLRPNTLNRWLGHFQKSSVLMRNGYTADNPKCAAYSDAYPITVGKEGLGYYETVCTLVPSISGDGVRYQGVRKCNSEGELWEQPISITLDFSTTYRQDMLTFRHDNGEPVTYLRCRMPDDEGAPTFNVSVPSSSDGAAEANASLTTTQTAGGASGVEACAEIETRQIRLECFDAAFRAGPRGSTPPPAPPAPSAAFTDAQGFTLMAHLRSRHQSVTLDAAGCAIRLTESRVIEAYNPGSFAEGGGWAGFMGATRGERGNGQIRRIGSRTDTIVVPVGNLDFRKTGPTGDNRFVFTVQAGAPILSTSVETTYGEAKTRHENRASRDHTITLSDGTSGPLPDIGEALQLLNSFNRYCRAR